MHRRFKGREGRRRLLEALLAQHMVEHDMDIARQLLKKVTLRTISRGRVFIKENYADSDLFFILDGKVSVLLKNRDIGLVRGSGEHVGEMALVDNKPRSASVKAIEPTVVACITEPEFTRIAEKSQKLWRRIAAGLAQRLRQRSTLIREPNPIPRVFVGSSSEALKTAKAVCRGLEDSSRTVELWKKPGAFKASYTTIENLMHQVGMSDYGVLVLGPDDTVISRKKKQACPRDNVLFELGLFMGSLGRERTLILSPSWKKIKWPSDLFGVTPLVYDSPKQRSFGQSIAVACAEIANIIRTHGPK